MSQRIKYNIKKLYEGVLSGSRTMLAKAITLIESQLPDDKINAEKLLNKLIPKSGNSIRIGITGSPGVGKSTFIDTFGEFLCGLKYKVAVLAIDPTSRLSGGSILGDKTRMEKLTRNKNAFIRPSPSGEASGGIAHKTREAIILCEAAGFDIILVETIGVGQNEIAVRSIVDIFILLIAPGAGDELQGIKRGSMEISDFIIVNKADGSTLKLASLTGQSYANAIQFMLPATKGWKTKVHLVSSLNNTGIKELWDSINEFLTITKNSGIFHERRQEQLIDWMNNIIIEELKNHLNSNDEVRKLKLKIEGAVFNRKISPIAGAEEILEAFYNSLKQ